MARRLVSVMVPTEGGPRAGGSGTEVRFYDDEALTTLSTVYQRATGAGTQPNGAGAGACLRPNAGANSALLADRIAGDAFVTVVDVTDFQVGDLVPVQDAVNTVYRVITIITPATKRLDLDSALGFAFLAAGTRVGNEDMKGHIWAYLEDIRDYHVQVKDIASGRLLPPVSIPTRVPVTTLDFQEEGVTVSTRGKVNFIGLGVTVVDDAANVRANVTIDAKVADVQVFTASGTWTKPAGAKVVEVIVIGAGGGGGAGSGAAAGNDRQTGGGGGGGAVVSRTFPAGVLGATESVTVGAAGAAGVAGGADGGVGGTSSFGSHVSAYGGGGGATAPSSVATGRGGGGGGAASAGATGTTTTGGAGGNPGPGAAGVAGGSATAFGGATAGNDINPGTAAVHGGGSGASGQALASNPGGQSLYGGPAGGSGGGVSSANVSVAGAAGGSINGFGTGGGGAGGAVQGGAGTAGTSRSGTGKCGDAGGGGAGNNAGAGGAGGAGGAPAAAGGGGGGGTPTGGGGGPGGRGEVIVVTYF